MHACTAHVLASTAHAPHTTGMNYACTTPTALNLALALSTKPQKNNPLPLPFFFVMHSLPAFFPCISFLLSCLSPHAWPSSCTVRFNCSCFILASGVTFFAKIYVQGMVGTWHIRLENGRKKKKTGKHSQAGNWWPFPGRDWLSVPRQGTSKRSQAGTGKRSQAGNWQAYPGRVLASVLGRDCKRFQVGNCRRPQAGDSGCSQAGNRRHCAKNAEQRFATNSPSATLPANQSRICVMSLHGNGTRGFS